MISKIFIEEWRQKCNWQTPVQVEQDLIISRALVELYNNNHIKNSLVFRGGTALNKLFIHPSSRYSEDIDLVQIDASPIGDTIDIIRDILRPWLGDPKRKLTRRSVKLTYKYETIDGSPGKLKIEINTTEHFQVLPLESINFEIKSEWFTGKSDIITYNINELMGTKLRALYQRRKGRDLFDIWYVFNHNLVDLIKVIDIFNKYCVYNNIVVHKKDFMKNLEEKRIHRDFINDMNMLLPSKLNWNFNQAYQFIIENVIDKLP